jgi:hypothetical protein
MSLLDDKTIYGAGIWDLKGALDREASGGARSKVRGPLFFSLRHPIPFFDCKV